MSKKRYNELLKSTNRKGIDNLISYMEQNGFYTSPCSTKHHLSEPGGLLKHSLNVCNTALNIAKSLNATVSEDSIIIASLLHDLGKMGDFGKPNYVENVLKSGKIPAIPYATNPDLLYLPHEIRSAAIAERFIHLKEDEEHAIVCHNGLYGDLKYAINGKETPLYLIIHFADMWASRVIE